MASGESAQISISDEVAARKWLGNIVIINEKYHEAMDRAAKALTEVKEFGDGTLVDELVNAGDKMLEASKSTFEAIGAISDTVSEFLKMTGGFIGDAIKIVKGVAGFFGG